MKSLSFAYLLALAVALVAPVSGADSSVEVEMKVRVYVGPGEIAGLAPQVLEFYDVTPDYFVGAVLRRTYESLVARGYKVEVLVADVQKEASKYDAFFHTYDQIRDTWAIIAQDHSNICVLDTLGTSAGGHLLLAMKISDNPGQMEQEPRICFDFTIHGNENNGTEVAHWVLLQILAGYGSDPDITRWVNEREIWLLPIVNPDGLVARRRTNNNGVDLNRNYGYSWDGGGPSVFSESETQVLYHLGVNNPMAMWTQYHSGAERAMWPWGYTQLATKDSVIHRYEMERYSVLSGYPACQISRGLYPVNGGSTDWYYGATGAQGYGIEVCMGQPSPPTQIDEINAENWLAMREMIERVMWGISGVVVDSVTDMPLVALVSVEPPGWFTYTDSTGYFHKNLHAGTYDVTVSANGYVTRTIEDVVVPADTFVLLNVALLPDSTEPACAFQVITDEISNSNTTDAWSGLRERDGVRFSLDRNAWVSYDMGRRTPIINGPGSDFYVVEDDGDPESYAVYVSNEWNGPWHSLGGGTGTQGFDLTAGGQSIARYVRIVDGGTGFDLDAVEAVVVNAPAIVYMSKTVVDSPPGGNGDGRLDPGEYADLILELKNVGRVGVAGVAGLLRTEDTLVSILDSLGSFGNLPPDSASSNRLDRFVVEADSSAPIEYSARMVLHLTGTDYEDSIVFRVTVGELRASDPIPDGPREPTLYWAYDDGDSAYTEAPEFEWFDITGAGTRLDLSDDQTVQVSLPPAFGPFVFYNRPYSQVSICGNGWLGPGYTTARDYENHQLPNPNDPTLLALAWDDLYPPTSGDVWWYHDEDNHRFIVQWDSMPYYNNRSTFDWYQVLLYDTTRAATDGNCVFVYQYLTANGYTACTVGENDSIQNVGIEVLHNGSYHRAALPVEPGRAVKYTTDSPRTGISVRTAESGPVPVIVMRGSHFSGHTLLQYSTTATGPATVAIYDNSGRKVRTLIAGSHRPGVHVVTWSGTDDSGRRLPAGVYLVRLDEGGAGASTKAVLVR